MILTRPFRKMTRDSEAKMSIFLTPVGYTGSLLLGERVMGFSVLASSVMASSDVES